MNEHFNEKIKLAIRSSQFHIQGIITSSMLENISFHLFQKQNKGVFIELIILMNNTPKTIKITNILLRIASGGGQIYYIDKDSNEDDCFLNIDKKIIISSKETEDDVKVDAQSQLANSTLLFKSLTETAFPVVHQSGQPDILFSASKEWVKAGDNIELTWQVEQAQSVILLPQNISVPLNGKTDIKINTDCLFTLQAKNEEIISEKRIFIKAVNSLGLTFSVYISTDQLAGYMLLQAHPEIPYHYAIPPDSHVRLHWESDRMGILSEKNWGEMPVNGFREMQIKEDAIFQFTWKTVFDIKLINLHFYILQEKKPQKAQKKEPERPSLFKLFKRRP